MTDVAAPPPVTDRRARIVGLDVARGVAVLGMFAAHLLNTVPFSWSDPSTWTDLVNGRSSILFATLAGVGIALIGGGERPVAGKAWAYASARVLTRAALLFVLGILLASLGTPIAIILHYYAVLFVLAVPLLALSRMSLGIVAGTLMVATPLLYAAAGIQTPRYDENLLRELVLTGYYPALVWITFLAVGMTIGRMPLRRLDVQTSLLAAGVSLTLIGYGIGAVRGGPALLTSEAHSGGLGEVVGSSGFAIGIIALCLLATRRGPHVLYPLAATGALALTAYSAQIIALAVIGREQFWAWQSWPFYLALVVPTVLLCSLYRLTRRRGPLEALLHYSSTAVSAPLRPGLTAPRP